MHLAANVQKHGLARTWARQAPKLPPLPGDSAHFPTSIDAGMQQLSPCLRT
jgi:hypothetical protein